MPPKWNQYWKCCWMSWKRLCCRPIRRCDNPYETIVHLFVKCHLCQARTPLPGCLHLCHMTSILRSVGGINTAKSIARCHGGVCCALNHLNRPHVFTFGYLHRINEYFPNRKLAFQFHVIFTVYSKRTWCYQKSMTLLPCWNGFGKSSPEQNAGLWSFIWHTGEVLALVEVYVGCSCSFHTPKDFIFLWVTVIIH